MSKKCPKCPTEMGIKDWNGPKIGFAQKLAQSNPNNNKCNLAIINSKFKMRGDKRWQ